MTKKSHKIMVGFSIIHFVVCTPLYIKISMIIILFLIKKTKKNLNILKCVLADNLIHQGKKSNKERKKCASHAQVYIDLTKGK